MTIPTWAVMLLVFLVAIFLLRMAALVISLQRDPHILLAEAALVLGILLYIAMQNPGHHEPLENLDVCTPAATAWPRAPQPTANLQGCSNYRPGEYPGSLPMPTLIGQRPDGTMPTPTSVANGG